MKKIILTHGVLSGAVIMGITLMTLALGVGESGSSFEWLGYLVMLLALSVIFVAIKRYRDEATGGIIRFGTAFLLGLGITAVASIIYVGVWEINLAVTDHAFIDRYTSSLLASREAEGMGAFELRALSAEMEALKERYANW